MLLAAVFIVSWILCGRWIARFGGVGAAAAAAATGSLLVDAYLARWDLLIAATAAIHAGPWYFARLLAGLSDESPWIATPVALGGYFLAWRAQIALMRSVSGRPALLRLNL